MAPSLVIVESPAKAKTIKKYLGKDFEVLASYGHVRDLVPKEGAVDPAQDFAMKYQVIDRNDKHVKAITTKLKKAEALYLATDTHWTPAAVDIVAKELATTVGVVPAVRTESQATAVDEIEAITDSHVPEPAPSPPWLAPR